MKRPWFKHWPPLLTKTLEYPKVPLFEFLESSARRFGDKTAVVYYGKEITFNQLLDECERFATFLSRSGIGKGDRVALYLQNSPQFMVAFFGTMRANAVVVPLNPMLVERELEYVLKDSGSRIVVTTSELASRVLPVAKDLGIEVVCGNLSDYIPEKPELPVPDFAKIKVDVEGATSWEKAMEDRDPPEVEVGSDDLALIPSQPELRGCRRGACTRILPQRPTPSAPLTGST